jgi:hypothetical protein
MSFVCSWCANCGTGRTAKHVAETVEDMTTVASHVGFTISVSRTRYTLSLIGKKK